MKYCPFCGTGLRNDMAFCPKCGKRFYAGEQNPEANVPVWDETVISNTEKAKEQGTVAQPIAPKAEADALYSAESTPVVVSAKKNSQKASVTILLTAFVIALVGILIYFNGNKKVMDIQDAANSVLYLEVYDNHDNITASASGFIISDGMTLVTNYHVVEHAYRIVAYTFDGNQSVEINDIITYDSIADIAVLKCKENIGLTPLLLGDSESANQGDSIYVIGYPLGLANTLSDGVVSSRYFDENNVDSIQITAPISSGSSGGPLLNKRGEVIGIVTAYYEDGQNINIAIATNELLPLLQSTSTTPLSDIYIPAPPEINENEFLQVDIDDLYNYPLMYDGENIKVEAWMSFYSYEEPTYSEHFYTIFLVNDKSAFIKNCPSNILELLEISPSLFSIRYEDVCLREKGIPYITGRIYDSKSYEKLEKREIKVTCYGQFTYNPMAKRYIDDPALYNLNIIFYELGK